MELTEPCPSCNDGVCSTCDGTGFEQEDIGGIRQPKTYPASEEYILCNCTMPESNGGFGQCNQCGGTGKVTRRVIDYEDPTLDEPLDYDISL